MLANHNPDTLASAIEGGLKRLEALETVVASLPGIGKFGAVALAATKAAETVVEGIDAGVDAVDSTIGADAPAAPAAKPAPATAAPSPTQIIAKAAAAVSDALPSA